MQTATSAVPVSAFSEHDADVGAVAQGQIEKSKILTRASRCPPSSFRVLFCVLCVFLLAPLTSSAQTTYPFDLPAQPLAESLRAVGHQTSTNVMFEPRLVKGLAAPALRAQTTTAEAMRLLLAGTKLSALQTAADTILIQRASGAEKSAPTSQAVAPTSGTNGYTRLAQIDTEPQSPSDDQRVTRVQLDEVVVTIPEILVVGSKVLNMDIRRTADDPQPYVIFDRAIIERSGTRNLEEFLKQRLPMNTKGFTFSQSDDVRGNRSEVNLRGLGPNQTLILVDGRRMANAYTGGTVGQPDLNGIPLAAIERVEVLPTTASGIYGGGATGGVINVILRRDYDGVEVKLTYDNTFDSDSSMRRVDLGAGFNFEGGKTNVMLAATHSDTLTDLLVDNRDFYERGISEILANNPATLLDAATPPLGATANVRSVSGSNLRLRDGTPLNSPITHIPAGYLGAASDGADALVANAGRYNLGLNDSGQAGRYSLLNSPTTESLMATVRRKFTPTIDAFLEIAASSNKARANSNIANSTFTLPASAASNPFDQDVRVRVATAAADGETISDNTSQRVAAGLIFQLPRGWMGEGDYTWVRSELEYSAPAGLASSATTAVSNGTLDLLRDAVDFSPHVQSRDFGNHTLSPLRSTLKGASLRLSGPVASLPAGALILTSLIEHRDEAFDDASILAGSAFFFPSRSQKVDSIYLEATVPVVSSKNALRVIRQLDLQVAGRYDDYTTNGSGAVSSPTAPITRAKNKVNSANPTVGLRYVPIEDVMLRGSYGTGFLPPAINQLSPNVPRDVLPTAFLDRRRGNEPTNALQLFGGGNPNLEPEESTSSSVGIVFTPRFVPGLRLSVDYTRIDKTEGITTLQAQQIIDHEAFLPDRIIRAPAAPGDAFGVGPITSIDASTVNLAKAEVEAYDASLGYSFETAAAGTVEIFAVGTWQTHFKTQVTPTASIIENVGVTNSNPLKFRANVGLAWRYRNWTLGWNTYYFDSYLISTNPVTILDQGNSGRVPSQTYHDAFATWLPFYDFGSGRVPALSGIEVQIGVRNVFDTEPPFDAIGVAGGSRYSTFGDPRLRSYQLSLTARF